jgi:hypothetical protein
MTRRISWALVVAIAAGGIGTVAAHARAADDAAAQAGGRGQTVVPPTLPAGARAKDVGDAVSGIRKTLATMTEAAVTKRGFKDMTERLVDEDRDRIGDFAKQDFKTLDGRIDQVRKAWRDKYGEDFRVDRDVALQKLALVRGEIEDPEAFSSQWPVMPVAADARDPIVAAAKEEANADAAKSKPGRESKIAKGRDVAIAAFPPSHGLPQVNASLVHELVNWKVDVPNTVSGQRIHDCLLSHLTFLGDHADRWPTDKNDAAAMFSHHVAMAAYGLDVPASLQRGQ